MKRSEKKFGITVNGIIFLALGGYTGEATGQNSKVNSKNVNDALIKSLGPDNAIIVKDNRLQIINYE